MNFKKFTCLLGLFSVLVVSRTEAQKVELKTTNYAIPTSGTVVYVAPKMLQSGSSYECGHSCLSVDD